MDEFNEDQKRFIDLSLNAKLTEEEWKTQFQEVILQQLRSDFVLRKYITDRKIEIQKEDDRLRKQKQQGFSDELIQKAMERLHYYVEGADDKLAMEAIKIITKGKLSYAVAYQARQAEKDSGILGEKEESKLIIDMGD